MLIKSENLKNIPLIGVFLILAIGVIISHATGFASGFMEDDFLLLNHSNSIKNIAALEVFNPEDKVFRPMMYILFGLEYFLFKGQAEGYRWVNIILYTMAAWSMVVVFSKLLKNIFIAWLIALMFIVHPINQNIINAFSSAYINLLLVFALWSLYFFHLEHQTLKSRIWAMVFFVLTLMTHEFGVLLIVYMFLLSWIVQKKSWGASLWRIKGYGIVLGLFIIFRILSSSFSTHLSRQLILSERSLFELIPSFIHLCHWYLMNLINPQQIVLMWSSKVGQHSIGVLLCSGLIWAAILFYLYLRSRDVPIVRWGLCWLVAGFLPLTVASMSYTAFNLLIEPYWFVLPSLGFFIMVAGFIHLLWIKGKKNLASIAIGVCMLSWLFSGYIYKIMWQDPKVYGFFWINHKGDYYRAHKFLANAYLRNQETQIAKEHLLKSHDRDNIMDLPRFYADLGRIHFDQQQFDKAKEYYQQAIKLAPKYYAVYTMLGAIALIERDYQLAENYFDIVIKNIPNDVIARLNKMKVLEKRQAYQEAIELLKEGLLIDPYAEGILVELFKMYLKLDDRSNVIGTADQLLSLSQNPTVLKNIGIIYRHYGDEKKAQKALDKAESYLLK